MRGLAIAEASEAYQKVTSLHEQLSNGVGLALSRIPITAARFEGDLETLLAAAKSGLDALAADAAGLYGAVQRRHVQLRQATSWRVFGTQRR